MKYIDAEKLIAEIERKMKCWEGEGLPKGIDSPYCTLKGVRTFVESLQQEQAEESIAKEAIQLVFEEKLTPFKDGNQWCFLLGHNIIEGICGFGDTILDAAIDFYKDYSTTRIHIGELKKTMEQPEVDLLKALDDYYNKAEFGPGDAIEYETHKSIAHHFYELGLNARKEE